MPLRVVMMGTGTFALPAFETIIDSEHDVAGLVTQPDRTGRGHHRHVNELKELAAENQIDIFQPGNVNSAESLARLREFQADLFVVAAYGQILSAELLEIPRLGAMNLHGSLLPKYRGAAPVQYAVLNGESESGVTIFQIEPKLDAGPILGMVRTDIGAKETSGQLHDRLAELAAPLTLEVLSGLAAGTLQGTSQDASEVSRAPKIRKEQGVIDWSKLSKEIGWHVRAMQPWPMPYTFLLSASKDPMRVLITDVELVDEHQFESAKSLDPGEIAQHDSMIYVGTGDSLIEVTEIQPAGKRRMTAEEFARGHNLNGCRFGPPN